MRMRLQRSQKQWEIGLMMPSVPDAPVILKMRAGPARSATSMACSGYRCWIRSITSWAGTHIERQSESIIVGMYSIKRTV